MKKFKNVFRQKTLTIFLYIKKHRAESAVFLYDYLKVRRLFFVIKTGYGIGSGFFGRTGSYGSGALLAFSADEEKNNKNSKDENYCCNYDPYPNRNSCGSGFSGTDFDLNKHNGRKRGNIDRCGFCGSGRNEFYFNNSVFVSFISEGGKTGRIFDNKAVNTVFLNEFYVGNSGFEIGFGGIEIGVFAVGHIIITFVIVDGNGMYHCKNIAVISCGGGSLGSVKRIGNSSGNIAVISKTAGHERKIESCKSISVFDEFCGCSVGYAVTVKRNNGKLGVFADIFFDGEFDFGNGDITAYSESKGYRFENIGFNNFRNGRAGNGRFGFGRAFRNRRAGAGLRSSGTGAGFRLAAGRSRGAGTA